MVGLGVSIATLFIAKGARTAAEDAKNEIRRRSLAEELQEAHTRAEQIGLFIQQNNWGPIFIRAQEISGACAKVLTRFSELTETSQTQLTLAREHASSIAKVAMTATRVAPSPQQLTSVTTAQRKLHDILSSELGTSLAHAERTNSNE